MGKQDVQWLISIVVTLVIGFKPEIKKWLHKHLNRSRE